MVGHGTALSITGLFGYYGSGTGHDVMTIAWARLLQGRIVYSVGVSSFLIDIQHSHCSFVVMHSLHYHSKAMNYIILSITHPHFSPVKVKPHGEAHSTSMLLCDGILSASEEACLLLYKSELILFSASYGSWVSDVRSVRVACMKGVLTCMNTSEHDCNNGRKVCMANTCVQVFPAVSPHQITSHSHR
jgi:hypothetical protein